MSESYNPHELPILAELEDEFARMVAAELDPAAARAGRWTAGAGDGRTPAPAPGARPARTGPAAVDGGRRRAPRRPGLSTGRRILGRALAAGALAGVVGATALATKSVVRGDGDGGPKLLERTAGHALTLRAYQGRSCLDIAYAGGVATACATAPGDGGVAPLSAVTPRGRVVSGLAGRDVARVVVRSGGRRAEAVTHAAPGGATRWFSVVLRPLPREANRAATVAPRGDGDRSAGATVADCTLGTAASCRSAREHSGGPDVN